MIPPLFVKPVVESALGKLTPDARWNWYSHEPKTRIFCVSVASRRKVVKYCWLSSVKIWVPRGAFVAFEEGPKLTVLALSL